MALITSRKMPVAYNTSTFGNATRDYQTIQAWWDAKCKDIDMVTAETGEVLICYDDDAPYNMALDTTTTPTTVNADYFPVIMAAPGQRGTKTSGVRFEATSSDAVFYTFKIWASGKIGIYNLGIKASGTGTHRSAIMSYSTGSNAAIISGCTIYDVSGGTTNNYGLSINSGNDIVVNNFIDGVSGQGFRFYSSAGSQTFYAYNNTIRNCATGILYNAVSTRTTIVISKNNIIQDNTTNVAAGGGLGTETYTPTTCATSGVTFAADGYSLASTDTGAIDEGTDLSSDATFAFNDDIFGKQRPGTSSAGWDIGAHEYNGATTVSISGTLKEKESGSGSAEHYILIDRSDGSVVEAGTAAAGGTFEIEGLRDDNVFTLIMPDKDGEYAPVAAPMLEGV